MSRRTQIIFSPHCDDAFLSLGGYITLHHDEVEVVDIFGTCAWTTVDTDETTPNVTEINQAEERAAAQLAQVPVTIYEYPEALMRKYRKWNTKTIHKADAPLSLDIYKTIRSHAIHARRVFFPIAPGHHVDHVLVHNQLHRLFDELAHAGVEVFVYEDLPYAWYDGVSQPIEKLSRKFALEPQVIRLSDEVMEQKMTLLGQYPSQLNQVDINKVREYAQSIEPNQYSERIWHLTQK
jgi:LmbE family N-acetylglucosaminyl deacetylase